MVRKSLSTEILTLVLGLCYLVAPTQECKNRIINGNEANPDSEYYPYVTALIKNGDPFCGGSLISNSVVLTAAHCLTDISTSNFTVRFGSKNLAEEGENIKPAFTMIHEDYNEKNSYGGKEHDIGLIFLPYNVSREENKRDFLPKGGTYPEPGIMATALGWGKTDTEHFSQTLREVEVPIISLGTCLSVSPLITRTMICAGYMHKGGKDSCSGDSGGPLIVKNKLAGIVSWGDGCAEPNSPGIYTNVAMYTRWIRDRIEKNKEHLYINTSSNCKKSHTLP